MNLDRLRFLADRVRNVATPVRTVTVTVRERTWPRRRGAPGDTPEDVDTVLPIRYKVRQLSSREISGSGGLYQIGDLKLGPITPPYSTGGGGGFTEAQLRPQGSAQKEILYVLTGDHEGVYKVIQIDTTHVISWYVYLTRNRPTP